MTNLLLLICLTFIRASESNSVGSIKNGHLQNGQILDRSIITYQRRAEINRELVKSHSNIGSAASSIRDKKPTNPLKNAEANAIRRGTVPNPLSDIDSQKFNIDTVNAKEANPFPGAHRGKVPNPLLLDDRLTREVMDIYEDFVSHQSLNGDEKHTNPNINAKEANQLTETVTGSHLSGVVPQNSRNPLKRKNGDGSFRVLEDVRKIESKKVPSNLRQMENHRTLVPKKQQNTGKFEKILSVDDRKMKNNLGIKETSKKDWESALNFFKKDDSLLDDEVIKNVIDEHIEQSPLEYDWKNWNFATPHPSNVNTAAGSARKMPQDSSIPIKKAIDTSRATRVISKLPRFLK